MAKGVRREQQLRRCQWQIDFLYKELARADTQVGKDVVLTWIRAVREEEAELRHAFAGSSAGGSSPRKRSRVKPST